jgi:hypothetical protein
LECFGFNLKPKANLKEIVLGMEQQYQNTQPNPTPQGGFGAGGVSKKKFWTILALGVVAAALLITWLQLGKGSPYGISGKDKARKEAQNLPAGFPADFPVDVTAEKAEKPQVGQNGEMILKFTSNLSPAQAYTAYLEYFEKKGWVVVSKTQSSVVGSITAKSPVGDILSLSLSPANENRSFVNASLVKGR